MRIATGLSLILCTLSARGAELCTEREQQDAHSQCARIEQLSSTIDDHRWDLSEEQQKLANLESQLEVAKEKDRAKLNKEIDACADRIQMLFNLIVAQTELRNNLLANVKGERLIATDD